VPTGLANDSDPEPVKKFLLDCANAQNLFVTYPEPDFGASSLDFEPSALISDISRGIHVTTDLRYEIFKVFKGNSIEFPFAKQDVYIKSMPGAPTAPVRWERRLFSSAENAAPRHGSQDPEPRMAEERDRRRQCSTFDQTASAATGISLQMLTREFARSSARFALSAETIS
jgi:hypothetical protein